MKWVKRGLIFAPQNNFSWMASHASVPTVDPIDADVLRIFFGTRDGQGRSQTGYIHVRADEPRDVLYVHPEPILPLGELGTFDDSGIMPSWIVDHGPQKYLYYIGWNPQVTTSYRLSIGVATSDDGGATFRRYSDGPVSDRSIDEPYFNTAPCVLRDREAWRMWYISCTKWVIIDDHPEPLYNIKYAESRDGLHWERHGHVCLDYDSSADAFGRPCVIRDGTIYKMFYSFRRASGYRVEPAKAYRLGYAESPDGLKWVRKDAEVGIEASRSGWDSQMIEYCFVYEHRGRKYMIYNGNGFGATGFGYAVLEKD